MNRWKHKYLVNSTVSKSKNNDTPSLIAKDGNNINHSITIANTLNDFFKSTSETVQSKIKFSNKSFSSLVREKHYSFVITATDKGEILKAISSLNTNKSCQANTIPSKILHLAQDKYLKIYVTYLSLQ